MDTVTATIVVGVIGGATTLAATLINKLMKSADAKSEGLGKPKVRRLDQATGGDSIPGEDKPISESPRLWISERSLAEVNEALKAIKRPLQRQEMLRSGYVGRWVRWSGTVQSVDRSSPTEGDFWVSVVSGRHDSLMLTVPKSDHAAVDALMEDDLIEYEGQLAELIGARLEVIHARILNVTKPPAFRKDPDQD
jgi:hypothetical protein